MKLKERKSTTIEIKIRAKGVGEGRIQIITSTGSYSDAISISIPIQEPFIGFKSQKEIKNILPDHSTILEKKISLPDDHFSNFGYLQVDIGNSSSIDISNLAKNFFGRNYYSFEAISSMILLGSSFSLVHLRMGNSFAVNNDDWSLFNHYLQRNWRFYNKNINNNNNLNNNNNNK